MIENFKLKIKNSNYAVIIGTVTALAVLAFTALLIINNNHQSQPGDDIPVFSFDKFNNIGRVESVGMGVVLAKNKKETQVQLQREDMRIGFTNMLDNTNVSIVSGNDKVSSGDDNQPVSIIYRLTDKGMKEEIVIRDKKYISSTFYYLLDLENLRMEKGNDGLWYFFKNDEIAPTFFIPKPFMIDAKGVRSEDLNLEIYSKDGKKYLALKADKSWLLSNERVLPITIDPSVIYDPPSVYQDIISKRTAQTKTVSIGNGKFVTTSYLSPVHYQDNQGQWRDISFIIESSLADTGFDYQNTNNLFETYFKKDTDGFIVEYKNGNAWLKLKPLANSVLGRVNLVNAAVNENSVTYPQIFNGVDLKFSVSDIFLEEFIVKDKEKVLQINDISENIVISGVTPQNQDDGSIKFIDPQTKKILWTFPRPVMYQLGDRSQASYGLRYTVTCLGENKNFTESCSNFIIAKTINTDGENWLSDPSRVYPVVIDASVGPYSPGVATGGDWSSPSNAFVQDDQYTSTGVFLATLTLTGYGFSVPSNATIDGIEVVIWRYASSNSKTLYVKDNTVQLVIGGTPSGSNYADTTNKWPLTNTAKTYGGAIDKWGLSPTVSQINSSDFGTVIAVAPYGGGCGWGVDYVSIMVYYTEVFPPQIDVNGVNLEGVDIN